MSSQSQSSRSSRTTTCFCGRVPVIVPSWKEKNVGRRFLGCSRYPDAGYCNFFQWFDPPMCDRSLQIIPGLLRKLDEQNLKMTTLETVVDNLEEKIRILQSMNCSLEKENGLLKLAKKKIEEGDKVMKLLVKSGKMIVLFCMCLYLIKMFSSLKRDDFTMEYMMIG
ncbi:hypothetical protein OROHE_019390 [Orobanche hederae]